MNLSIGIVGLPNVGKSTLFNALLKRQQALVANYPFATIEPNVGVVAVPDPRLDQLAEITKTEEKMGSLPPLKPATVNFVDIAGLVKGASEGAGLGNKFLSHIREVSVIAHVVRAFEDADVVREGSVGVKEDYETINTELILADIQTLTKTLENRKLEPSKKVSSEKLLESLNKGSRAYDAGLSEIEQEAVRDLSLLTFKPEVVVLNVSEESYNPSSIESIARQYSELIFGVKDKGSNVILEGAKRPIGSREDSIASLQNDNIVVISAKIEAELASLSEEEQKEYLKDLGLEFSGLERLIQKAYEELGLISFLTTGAKEVRAWTIKKGINAQMAAGEIHTDFIKKFIKAEIVSFADFVENNGWKGSREKGRARLEGRNYIIKDGDVVEFKIGT